MTNDQTKMKTQRQDRKDDDYEAALNDAAKDLGDFLGIPVTLNVILGQKTVTLKELLGLAPGSLLVLDRRADEKLSIYLEDRFFARGEFSVGGDTLGARITEIHDPGKW